jgi:methionyl aminopeptidase
MSIESADDWKGLRRAGRIAHLTLDALEASVRPDVSTAELDAVAARIFAEHGARSAPAMVYGFPGTVLISVNDEVVHGIPDRAALPPVIWSSSMSRSRRMATSPTPPVQ